VKIGGDIQGGPGGGSALIATGGTAMVVQPSKIKSLTVGGSLLGGWARGGFPMPSDRRAKEDIRRIGTADNGLPIYVYRYKGQRTHQIGFMADEVREVRPEAVVNVGGLDHVRYDLAVR
jgi:hypothetical protein